MKRNIITNFIIKKDQLQILVLEKLTTSIVSLFSQTKPWGQHNLFMKESLDQIKTIVGCKIKNIYVMIEPFDKVKASISILSHKVKIAGHLIQRQDYENLNQLICEKIDPSKGTIIFKQPIQFEVHDVIVKKYSNVPLNKRGQILKMTSALTVIDSQVHTFIEELAKLHDLTINQIMLTQQSLTFNSLSDRAKVEGAMFLNVEKESCHLMIVKNYAVITIVKFDDFSYQQLINQVAKYFNCSPDIGHKLIIAHGNLKNDLIRRKIYLNTNIKDNTNVALNQIISDWLSKFLIVVQDHIRQKLSNQLLNLPLIIGGSIVEIVGLEEFTKDIFKMENISIYHPLTYVEINSNNHYGLGIIKFIEKSDQISGAQYDTIVETNPDLLEQTKFISFKRKNIFGRLIEKIGGKYGRN